VPFNHRQALATSVSLRSVGSALPKPWRCRAHVKAITPQTEPAVAAANSIPQPTPHVHSFPEPAPIQDVAEVDPLYLLACHIEWERREDTGAGWELLSAAQSSNQDTRAQARALLAGSQHLGGTGLSASPDLATKKKRPVAAESEMKAPYNLDIVDNCAECTHTHTSFFCAFSQPVLHSVDLVSHKSILPAGAILFVEGQTPRGMFILCSGKVNLSTTSREGKILILKTVVEGETLGLSASISGLGYEATAETSTPCHLCFIDRKRVLELMEAHSEMSLRAAQCLSRDYQSAYRDIHDLVLTRSSAGKLARLLLSQTPSQLTELETRLRAPMTHEEMGQRIGASRETVTRLLTNLRKKQLIRLDGATLIIRDRVGLEALAT
jgi:CRP/FNR family cyclic AMP-dependent transcriptional regulator